MDRNTTLMFIFYVRQLKKTKRERTLITFESVIYLIKQSLYLKSKVSDPHYSIVNNVINNNITVYFMFIIYIYDIVFVVII